MQIRQATAADAHRMAEIYNYFIDNTTITFEEQRVTAEEMAARIEKTRCAGMPWLVIEHSGEIAGYAYAGPWNTRTAYRFTAEPSVYLAPDSAGKGLGYALYQALLAILKDKGIKNVLGVIALPNAASIGLHEAFGFTKVGEFSDVGYKLGRWISVGYWQLKLNL